MSRRVLEGGAWVLCLLVLASTGWRLGGRHPGVDARVAAQRPVPLVVAPPAESLAAWAGRLSENNPFRFERRPATVRFGEHRSSEPEPDVRPLPVLTLLGTVGGPPWQAVVAGLPGRPGTSLLRPGDRVGDFQVRSVVRDTAILRGLDSTWILVQRRPSP